MLTAVPQYVVIVFIATVLLTLYFFYRSATERAIVAGISIIWLALTGILAYKGFYKNTSARPPHFMFAVVPPLLAIIISFATRSGRRFMDEMNLRMLTLLHIVRVPVELTLYWLFLSKAVPQLMTFEGRNFDILSGITAPFVYFICFKKDYARSRGLLLAWNIICLLLLLNIVINAILALPFPFQQFAFDQPNIAVLYFPFVWLPACIVMIVLFSHLVAIRQLTRTNGTI